MMNEKEMIRVLSAADNAARLCEGIITSVDQAIKNGDPSLAQLADIYSLFKRATTTVDTAKKEMNKKLQFMQFVVLPEKFEEDEITTITTESGFRVTVSEKFSASMPDREKGKEWLRENNLEDLIQETVNAQTLSAALKSMIQDEGIDPPEDIFKCSYVSSVSITKVKKSK